MGRITTDWTKCELVETVPGKLSGQPVIRHSRVRPDDLVSNREQGDEWLAQNYGLPVRTVRQVLKFYESSLAPHS